MRKINTRDTVALARIINSTNLKEELIKFQEAGYQVKKEAEKITDEDEKSKFIAHKTEITGLDFALTLFTTATSNQKTETALYEIIAGILETKEDGSKYNANDIGDMELETLFEKVKLILAENNVIDFFKRALQLTNPQ